MALTPCLIGFVAHRIRGDMEFSQHSGMVVCCDGTQDADRRIVQVLWNDPATDVMRYADAGYDVALECARYHIEFACIFVGINQTSRPKTPEQHPTGAMI